MPSQPERLTEDEIRSSASRELQDARDWIEEKINPDRKTNLDYYHLEPFGNEVEGRSQVITADCREVVESMLPVLVRVFTAQEDVVQFEPEGPDDVAVAKQATDYVGHIYQRQNEGFAVTYTLIKDALREKTSWAKVWADESEHVSEETYEGKTEDELALLLTSDSDEEIEPIESTPNEDGTFDVKVRRKTVRAKIRVEAVPPEEILSNRDAKNVDEARFLAHVREVTRSTLVEMGIDRDDIDRIPVAQDADDESTLADARARVQETDSNGSEALDWSETPVIVAECYLRIDADGDGISELHQILLGGAEGGVLLSDEVVDMSPFVAFTPIPEPHRLIGNAVIDVVREIQLQRSTILRQFFDNLYRINQGSYIAVEGQVEMDDLLSSAPARIIRANNRDAVTPLQIPEFGRNIPFAMEFLQQLKEQWTGQSRLNQGLDASAFGKTATGTTALLSASQGRIELIARSLAEIGFKTLFRKILRLVVKHQNQPQIVRLRGEWVPIDPNSWNERMDLTVHVGLGIEGRQVMTEQLLAILDRQLAIAQNGGQGVLVTAENIHETLVRLTQNLGFRDAGAFWADPAQAQPQPQEPDPQVLDIQMKREQKEKDRKLKETKMMLEDDRVRDQLGIAKLEFIEGDDRGAGSSSEAG